MNANENGNPFDSQLDRAFAEAEPVYAPAFPQTGAALGEAGACPDLPKTDPDAREVLTYSAISTFRACRRKYFLRYVQQLAPAVTDEALDTGSLFHEAVAAFSRAQITPPASDMVPWGVANKLIDDRLDGHNGDPAKHRRWHLVHAMLDGYVKRWVLGQPALQGDIRESSYEVLSVEQIFKDVRVRNPKTGYPSQTFDLAGKVDAVVRMRDDGKLYVRETKTASRVDGAYLDRLWTDFQIRLYSRRVSELYNEPVAGVIYDIAAKARLEQKSGESAEEFEARKLTLKSPGRAKQQLAESDDDFARRLADWYASPEAFCRQIILFSDASIAEVEEEVWEQTQQLLDARRRGRWSKNEGSCYSYGRACPFAAICQLGQPAEVLPETVASQYVHRPPHQELLETNGTFEADDATSQAPF